MNIANNIAATKQNIPNGVKLVAVSKFHPTEAIQEAYDAGQRCFGESRMQELDVKQKQLPNDIEWHFIGHLQTKKVKNIIPYTHVIHSVDSWKLLCEIEKQAANIEKPISCLLEIHIAREDAKSGFSYDECRQMLENGEWKNMKYARICGVMSMATYTDNREQIRSEFEELKSFFDELKGKYFADNNNFTEISMGMSGDYLIAIEQGATIVRVGSSIFGNR